MSPSLLWAAYAVLFLPGLSEGGPGPAHGRHATRPQHVHHALEFVGGAAHRSGTQHPKRRLSLALINFAAVTVNVDHSCLFVARAVLVTPRTLHARDGCACKRPWRTSVGVGCGMAPPVLPMGFSLSGSLVESVPIAAEVGTRSASILGRHGTSTLARALRIEAMVTSKLYGYSSGYSYSTRLQHQLDRGFSVRAVRSVPSGRPG